MNNSSDYVIIGLLVFLIVGCLASMFAEMLVLRKTGWVEGNLSLTYPLATNALNIAVAAVAYFMAMFVIMFLAFFVLPSIAFGIQDTHLQTGLMIVYYPVSAIVMFFFFWLPFSFVRWLTTKLMIKSAILGWKYQAVQAAIPASMIAIVYLLIMLIPYLKIAGQ